jgi:hypothetical protein
MGALFAGVASPRDSKRQFHGTMHLRKSERAGQPTPRVLQYYVTCGNQSNASPGTRASQYCLRHDSNDMKCRIRFCSQIPAHVIHVPARELTCICPSCQPATEMTEGVFDTSNQEERWQREYMKQVGEQTDPVGLSII